MLYFQVQLLQGPPVEARQLFCPTVHLLLRLAWWVARYSGGHTLDFVKTVSHSIRSRESQKEVRSQLNSLATVLEVASLLGQLCCYQVPEEPEGNILEFLDLTIKYLKNATFGSSLAFQMTVL